MDETAPHSRCLTLLKIVILTGPDLLSSGGFLNRRPRCHPARARHIESLYGGGDHVLILANTITADMGLIPGLAFVGPAMGLPLSVMAAFVERPFYSLAGVKRHTIWYSLQANLVSLGVGFVGTLIAAFVADAMRQYDAPFVVWPFLAICVSILVERWYLQLRARPNFVKWGWSALGNVLSAALCVGVLFLVVYLRRTFPGLRQTLHPYAGPLQIIAFVGSAALFLVSFREPATADVVVVGEPAAV